MPTEPKPTAPTPAPADPAGDLPTPSPAPNEDDAVRGGASDYLLEIDGVKAPRPISRASL